MKKTLSVFLLFSVSLSFAQQTSSLTVERIMRDVKWMGISPSNIQWGFNSTKLYFKWNPQGALRDPLYHITPLSHIPQLTSDTLKRSFSKGPFIYSRDRSKVVFERDGDIVLGNVKTGVQTVLVGTTETESNPVFNKDDSKVIFQKGDNLFTISLQIHLS